MPPCEIALEPRLIEQSRREDRKLPTLWQDFKNLYLYTSSRSDTEARGGTTRVRVTHEKIKIKKQLPARHHYYRIVF